MARKRGDHFPLCLYQCYGTNQNGWEHRKQTWTQIVWRSCLRPEVHARQSMEFNLTPDGMAIAVGLVSTTIEDAALGYSFYASWSGSWWTCYLSSRDWSYSAMAAIKAFVGTSKESSSLHAYNEKADYNAYQFDFIFNDGAQCRKVATLVEFIYITTQAWFCWRVMFSNNPYHSGFGEKQGPALMRSAARVLADK